jgi:hypothetical protein
VDNARQEISAAGAALMADTSALILLLYPGQKIQAI